MDAAAAPSQACCAKGLKGDAWVARVRELQVSRMTPELLGEMRARAERQRAQVQVKRQAQGARRNCAKARCGMREAMPAMKELDEWMRELDGAPAATEGVICPHCKSFQYYYCTNCPGNKIAFCAAHNVQARNKHPLHVKMFESSGQKCPKCREACCIQPATQGQVLEQEKKQATMYQGRLDEGTRNSAYSMIVERAQEAWAPDASACAEDGDAGDGDYAAFPAVADSAERVDEAAQAGDEAVRHEESDAAVEEFDALLESFRADPAGDAEAAAKFKLYEAYFSTVELVRGEVLRLWGAAEGQLPAGPVRAAMGRDVRGIEAEQHRAIADFAPGRWFVYDMARKAEQNNRMLGGILRGMESKLRLLADQQEAECPFCLEPVGGAHPGIMLGCCHRVGRACWDEWRAHTAAAGTVACCPLCRHADFVDGLGAQ